MAQLKVFFELIEDFHGKAIEYFPKITQSVFHSLYHAIWIFGYSRVKDAQHILFKKLPSLEPPLLL